MKRVVIHPEEPQTGKRYWRSLSEFERNPSFQAKLEREFQEGQAEMKSDDEREASRRDFLKLMGASTALAGMAACRRPEAFIKPYVKSPEWVIPGKALFYATAMPRLGGGVPLVVTSFEGRPTHLAGNPLHPESNGSVDIYAQGSVLGLYDPDRAKNFTLSGKKSTKEAFIKALGEKKAALATSQGKGLAILLDENNSPTRARLVGELKKKFSGAKVYKYEALAPVGVTTALTQAFGDGIVPVYHLEKAARIVSLDCDFMGLDRIGNNATSDFMKGRKAEKEADPMNRLYVAEARYSMTGGMADHRLRVGASQIFKVASELAAALGVAGGKGGDVGHPDAKAWIEEAAKDLKDATAGKAVVLAGNGQPAEVHLLVAAINQALGAFGSIIELKQGPKRDAGTLAELSQAIAKKEVTDVLAITEADPAFDAPADLKFADSLKQVKTILVSTRHRTATGRIAEWAVPATHYLEQWGDVRGTDGTYSIVQPMILPLFGGLSDLDVLNLLLDDSKEGDVAKALTAPVSLVPLPVGVVEDPGAAMKAVRATFDTLATGAANKEDAWNITLRDGFLGKSAYPAAAGTFNAGVLTSLASFKDVAAASATDMELNLTACSKVWDGRYINNGWLQEAPDPVSKVTWDNCAMLSVKTAKALKITREFLSIDVQAAVIAVTVNGVTKELPAVVVPGHADNVITVNVGYGQGSGETGPGLVGNGTGTDVWGLRSSANPYFATAKVTLTEKTSPLALTQEHSSMYGRALVREGTQEDWKHNADFVLEMGSDAHVQGDRAQKKAQQDYTFYKPVGDKDADGNRVKHLNDELHQWGMVIDLNRCIGCSACLVACQSENNIPIVGKEQVIRGREMHWIRMDRYFATDLDENVNPESSFMGSKDVWEEDFLDEPEMVVQPVACQQCESAPCETVCPVNATVHSPDGLNVMVYNRCIGTRYCANNCPFKARRFNFFDYNKRNPLVKSDKLGFEHGNLYDGPLGERWDTELSKLQKNPNVSVRMRGVMEKCTYCLQRIEGARADARSKGRKQAALDQGKFDETLVVTNEDIRIKTDSVKVACQQACPADAIMFGNIADEKSTVNKWIKNSRNYELLSYLAIKTRTSYLARIKNPNPKLLERVTYERTKAGNASKLHVGHQSGAHKTEGTGAHGAQGAKH